MISYRERSSSRVFLSLSCSRAPMDLCSPAGARAGAMDVVQGWNIPSQLWAACWWSTAGHVWGCRCRSLHPWHKTSLILAAAAAPCWNVNTGLCRTLFVYRLQALLGNTSGWVYCAADKVRNREGKTCFLQWRIKYHRIPLKKVFSRFLEIFRDLRGEGILPDCNLLRCLLQECEVLLLFSILARLSCFSLNESWVSVPEQVQYEEGMVFIHSVGIRFLLCILVLPESW